MRGRLEKKCQRKQHHSVANKVHHSYYCNLKKEKRKRCELHAKHFRSTPSVYSSELLGPWEEQLELYEQMDTEREKYLGAAPCVCTLTDV